MDNNYRYSRLFVAGAAVSARRLGFSLSEQCAISILVVALLVHAWTVYEGFKRRQRGGASWASSTSLFQPRTTTTRGLGRNINRSSSSLSSSSLVNHLIPEIGLTLTQDHLDPIASRKWKEVLAWIVFHPDELKLRDKGHHTVLHHACLFRAPAEIIQMILWQAPELASIQNLDGEVALHWAIRLSAPLECLNFLLNAAPEAGVAAKDKDGNTPLSLLWDRHQEDVLETWWEGGRDKVLALPSWKRLMLFFQQRNESVESTNNIGYYSPVPNVLVSPLHLACKSPCPPNLFPFMVKVYKDEIKKPDRHGRLPLGIACSDPVSNRSTDILTKVQMLLPEYPAAATHVTAENNDNDDDELDDNNDNDDEYFRTPFLTAVASGVAWDEGLENLFLLDPRCLSKQDPVTKLFPFQLAAMGSHYRQEQWKHHKTAWRRIFKQQLASAAEESCCSLVKDDEEGGTTASLSTIYKLLRSDPMRVLPQR